MEVFMWFSLFGPDERGGAGWLAHDEAIAGVNDKLGGGGSPASLGGRALEKRLKLLGISAPEVKLAKPEIELKAFAKTDVLDVNGEQQITMTIPAETLASFDAENNQWIIEPGRYAAFISSSSDVSRLQPVRFQVDKEIVVSKTTPGILSVQDEYADALKSRLMSK